MQQPTQSVSASIEPLQHRALRISFSGAFGILCLLLIVLSVRSYWQVAWLLQPTAASKG
jgi:hypothetical protein